MDGQQKEDMRFGRDHNICLRSDTETVFCYTLGPAVDENRLYGRSGRPANIGLWETAAPAVHIRDQH